MTKEQRTRIANHIEWLRMPPFVDDAIALANDLEDLMRDRSRFAIGDHVRGIADEHYVANTNLTDAEVVGINCADGKEKLTLRLLQFKDEDAYVPSATFEVMASIFGEKDRKLHARDLIGNKVYNVEAENYERL